jgi:hypothetical protein
MQTESALRSVIDLNFRRINAVDASRTHVSSANSSTNIYLEMKRHLSPGRTDDFMSYLSSDKFVLASATSIYETVTMDFILPLYVR